MAKGNITPTIVIPGGGSGPLTIEDSLLDLTPNVIAITDVTDNGGHTREIRSVLGVSPTGDASQRLAIRIRNNPKVRSLLTYRFPENGQRSGNTQLAAAERIAGSHSKGIRLLEEAYTAWYKGKVLPVSDDKIHLRVFLQDGTSFVGEEKLDDLKSANGNVVSIDYVIENPDGSFKSYIPSINSEVVKKIKSAEAIIIPPGSWWGSILAVLEVPGCFQAISESSAPVIILCNAADFKGATASFYLKYLAGKINRLIDHAIINVANHPFPKTYEEEGLYPVSVDLEECQKYTKNIHSLPLTKVYSINGKPTVRHDGAMAATLIMKLIFDTITAKSDHTMVSVSTAV